MNELQIEIDAKRICHELQHLATISDCPEPLPAVTRVVFTKTDLIARKYLQSLYEAAGLTVRVDPLGNTFARWTGSDPELPAVGTGSHTDAIPYAGMYDGTVGVLGGLEAIRALQTAGFQPRRSIELLMFTSEEPTRFGVGCIGSRALVGQLSVADLIALRDAEGNGLDDVRLRAGFSSELADVLLSANYYHAWLELHIEQGPELEAARVSIGIVTAIAAPATLLFTIDGAGGHAGAVLMPQRKDALCAAAAMVTAIERAARDEGGPNLVATVGKLAVHPGAENSIPSRVRFTMDIRDIDHANRDRVLSLVMEKVNTIAAQRGVTITSDVLHSDPPATCAPEVLAAVERACQRRHVASVRMISRAYHDSSFMARFAPMGMIFIPCRGGVSHHPDEYSSPEQIAAGVEVLALALADLAQ